jgi:hypothetical protein
VCHAPAQEGDFGQGIHSALKKIEQHHQGTYEKGNEELGVARCRMAELEQELDLARVADPGGLWRGRL